MRLLRSVPTHSVDYSSAIAEPLAELICTLTPYIVSEAQPLASAAQAGGANSSGSPVGGSPESVLPSLLPGGPQPGEARALRHR